MDQAEIKVASLQTVKRLPAYLVLLRKMLQAGRTAVSSNTIGELLKLDAIQVRKDLAATGIEGKPKVGFSVEEAISAIEGFLGWDNAKEAFIAGAGNLGKALIGYPGFSRYGLKIIAAFDRESSLVGTRVSGVEVLDISKITDLAERMHVKIGIIAVPAEAAQDVCDAMVQGGMKAIWNFAPVKLRAPEDVSVQDEDLASGLAVLSYKLEKSNGGDRR